MDNPHLDVEPDYMLLEYDVARLILTVKEKTNKEVANLLLEVWWFTYEKICTEWDHKQEIWAWMAREEQEWLAVEMEQQQATQEQE